MEFQVLALRHLLVVSKGQLKKRRLQPFFTPCHYPSHQREQFSQVKIARCDVRTVTWSPSLTEEDWDEDQDEVIDCRKLAPLCVGHRNKNHFTRRASHFDLSRCLPSLLFSQKTTQRVIRIPRASLFGHRDENKWSIMDRTLGYMIYVFFH